MNVTQKTRQTVLIAAIVILLLCVIWTFTRGRSSERSRICAFLAEYGYDCTDEDLLFAYDEKNTSIRTALGMTDMELEPCVNASRNAGFPSDVDKTCSVTLILYSDGTDTVYMYMADGEPELVFTEDRDGNIKPVR